MDESSIYLHLSQNHSLEFEAMDRCICKLALAKGLGEEVSLQEILIQEGAISPKQWEEIKNQIFSEKENKPTTAPTWPPSSEEELPPSIGDFYIEKKLGQGGMGVVYQALHKESGERVALKLLRQDVENYPELLHRFSREVEAISKLKHPHIVSIHQLGHYQKRPFFTMEFVDGPSLEERLKEKSVSLTQGLEIIEAIARALGYAHARGVIHRDIKPSNILIDSQGRPKLTDFGLAKHLDSQSLITHTGEIVGTISYMAPEQATGQSNLLDHRCDIYSLGVILYQICTGRLPFTGKTTVELLCKIAETDPLFPRKFNSSLPREVEAITLKALAKDPSQRYQNCQDLAGDIRRFLEGQSVEARPLSFWEKLKKKGLRNKAVVILAGLFLGTIGGLLLENYFLHCYLENLQKKNQANLRRSRQNILALEAKICLKNKDWTNAQKKINSAFQVAPPTPLLFLLRAKLQKNLGDLPLALQDLQKAHQLEPNSSTVLYERAEVYAKLQLLPKAIRDYSQLIQKKSSFPYLYYKRAKLLYLKERYPEAIYDLQQQMKLTPRFQQAYLLLSQVYIKLKLFSEAVKTLLKLAKQLPLSPEANYFLAEAYFHLGNYPKSIEAYTQAIQSAHVPYRMQAHLKLASLLRRLGRIWQGIEELENALRLHPNHVQALRQKAELLMEAGEFQTALQTLQKLAAIPEGMSLKDKLTLAKLYLFYQQPTHALEILLPLISSPKCVFLALQILLHTKKDKQAQQWLKSVNNLEKLAPYHLIFWGVYYFFQKNYERAVLFLTQAKKSRLQWPLIYALLGYAYLKLDRPLEEAKNLFQYADQLSLKADQEWSKFYLLGIQAEKMSRWRKAIEFYRYALILNPVFSRAFYRLSRCYRAVGEKGEKNRQALQNSLRYNPFFKKAHLDLIRFYLQEKKLSKAQIAVKKAQKFLGQSALLPPPYPWQFLMGQLYYLEGKYPKAQKIFQKLSQKKKEWQSFYLAYSYLAKIAQKKGDLQKASHYRKLYLKYHKTPKEKIAILQKLLNNGLYSQCLAQASRWISNNSLHEAYFFRAKARLLECFQQLAFPQLPPKIRKKNLDNVIWASGLDLLQALERKPSLLQNLLFASHPSSYAGAVKNVFLNLSKTELQKRFLNFQNSYGGSLAPLLKGVFYFYLHQLGRLQDSELHFPISLLDQALRQNPFLGPAWLLKGYFLTLKKKFSQAQYCFHRAKQQLDGQPVLYLFQGIYFAQKKQPQEAISQLHLALDNGFEHLQILLHQPLLTPLSSHPEWKVLIRRIKSP
ncbi:MAG: serine/threonine-protein kinase [Planctomycetota bacterium]|nr:MAG: serine/threonine-protein kinase [Planctomycetota bacterium]